VTRIGASQVDQGGTAPAPVIDSREQEACRADDRSSDWADHQHPKWRSRQPIPHRRLPVRKRPQRSGKNPACP